MKAIIFSDLHAHNWSAFSELIKYRNQMLNSRLVDAARVIDRIRKYSDKHNIDVVFMAGDLFHRKRLIDITVYNTIASALWRLSEVVEVVILAGNHDQVSRMDGDHSLFALSGKENITVVDKPTWTVVNGRVALIPYYDNRTDVMHAIEKVDAEWMIMHVGVDGAKTGEIEFRPPEPVKVSDLPDIPIYLGHYHYPQTLSDKIVYVGSPMEHDRGDKYHPERGFVVVDLDAPNKYKRVKLTMPRIMRVRAGDTLDEAAIEELQGNFVDLVTDETLDQDDIAATMKVLRSRGARYVIPVFEAKVTSKPARLSLGKNKFGKLGGGGKKGRARLPTIHEVCDAYVEASDTELDKKKLRRIAKEVLEQAEMNT